MRDHLTKAIGLHVADEVWETVDRHLFADSSGRRHGPPRVGSWWEFTRIVGRARSHTKTTPVWETYRLVGALDGHLDAYRHSRLPMSVSTAIEAAGWPAGSSILAQPARLPAPCKPPSGSWWDHDGALAVVFTGLPGGDLVLPVRLPQGAGQWAHCVISWPTRACGTRSTLSASGTVKRPAAGGTTRICSSIRPGISRWPRSHAAPRSPAADGRGWMPTCPIWRWPRSPTISPATWSSIASAAHPTNSTPRLVPPRKRGPGKRRWIGLGATPTRTSTARQHVRPPGQLGAPHAGWRPRRSLTRAGPGMPALMVFRCTPTVTTRCRAAINASAPTMPPTPAAPVRLNTPAPATSRRASWPPTAVRSRSRTVQSRPGRACGASESPCSARACS